MSFPIIFLISGVQILPRNQFSLGVGVDMGTNVQPYINVGKGNKKSRKV